MGFFVSRQRDFKSNFLVVEIAAGGPKKAGPDILTARYAGEQKNLVDPRDALNVAERIYKLWERDYWDEKKYLKIIVDSQNIYMLDFSPKGLAVAQAWADKVYATMEKCGSCKRMMGNSALYEVDEIPNMVFCDEACCARKYRDMFGKEPPKISSGKTYRWAKK
jgi:hypothetical protein